MSYDELLKMVDWLITMVAQKNAENKLLQEQFDMLKYEHEKLKLEVRNDGVRV